MGRNFNEGDRVISLASLGHGVTPGSKGTITHVSTFHGLVTVRFENGAEVQGVKMERVEHGYDAMATHSSTEGAPLAEEPPVTEAVKGMFATYRAHGAPSRDRRGAPKGGTPLIASEERGTCRSGARLPFHRARRVRVGAHHAMKTAGVLLTPPIPIPSDVQTWLRDTFRSCNERVSSVVTRVPTTHETSLDMSFIEHFAGMSAPVRFPSGWIVEISTHFLGGGRHFGDWPEFPRRWEIADIGFLVLFRQGGRLIRSKVALLQSKRLYADEQDWDEDNPLDYMIGFGRLFKPDDDWGSVIAPRRFGFTPESRYKALTTGVPQYNAISQYETQRGIPVYYLLYHPWQIPHSVVMPLTADYQVTGTCDIGCRVVPAAQLRAALIKRPEGHSPAYDELRRGLADPFKLNQHQNGWRLEHFVVDLLLECEVGYIANSPNDGGLNYIFNRRTGPISAALALTIDAP